MEKFLANRGYVNLGLPQKIGKNKVYAFFYNLLSVLKAVCSFKRGDLLILQYPLKKYYLFLTRIAQRRGVKVITLIHDLGYFRRKKITLEEEMHRLSKTDYLIALSSNMKDYMLENGYKQGIGTLDVWDYISDVDSIDYAYYGDGFIDVAYVGGLKDSVNGFIYKLDRETEQDRIHFDIYGDDFEEKLLTHKERFRYHGITDSDDIIVKCKAHYGLLWYGKDYNEISGYLGEYLKINTSHKISLYILAHKPLIVWSKASFATLTKQFNIGVCVDSLEDLQEKLSAITEEEYHQMVQNTVELAKKLKIGNHFLSAVEAGIDYINAKK